MEASLSGPIDDGGVANRGAIQRNRSSDRGGVVSRYLVIRTSSIVDLVRRAYFGLATKLGNPSQWRALVRIH